MTFPAAVPEVPASNLDRALDYYVRALGFTRDWISVQDDIAGVSQGSCRLFLTGPSFRQRSGNISPIVLWINVGTKAEVDELFARWHASQAKIVSTPRDTAWKLREFLAADLDQNILRVFYDFREST